MKKNKSLSLLIVLLIYIISFGAGAAVLLALSSLPPLWALFLADAAATAMVFIFNLMVENASVYDPYWSVQPILLIGAMYWRYARAFQPVHLFVLIPLLCWSVRLTGNWMLGFANLEWEDWRYRDLKSQNPRFGHMIIFIGVMMMPTALVFLGTIPVWHLLQAPEPGIALPAAGGMVILAGTALEFTADSQMRRYKSRQDRSPYIDEGLWRYSRHPNYLGEILVWVGLFIAGLENFRPLGAAGVLLIMLLFCGISIPMMERHILEKKPEYKAYQKTVQPLIFWFRRM